LMTETEADHYKKGVTKGDQGQRNKQQKAMLREFVQAVKRPNISMIVTSQVYRNQDITNGEGTWVVSDAVKYSLSQIVLLTRLKLRVKETRETLGIKMTTEGYKTRFTKPYQSVQIHVPYETGMDPYNGLLEVAVEMGIVTQKGSRFSMPSDDKSWYSKEFDKRQEDVLVQCEAKREKFLEALVDEDEIDFGDDKRSSKQKRIDKAAKALSGKD